MKRNKAFTLIELLGVIIILGVIALIITPAIDRTIKKSQEKLYNTQKSSLITAVKNWSSNNKEMFINGNVIIITLQDLKEENYIAYDVKNPKTDTCLSNAMQFRIEKSGKKYTYSIIGDELVDGLDADCNISEKNISIYLLGENPYRVEINSNYTLPGVVATDSSNNDVTSSVTSTNNINISKLGSYQVTYALNVDGLSATKIRNVEVVDTTAPVIYSPIDLTISKDVTTLNLLDGVSAVDNSGSLIEVNVVEKITYGISGEYEVKYVAVDPSGNIATHKRIITISK